MSDNPNQYIKKEVEVGEDFVTIIPDDAIGLTVDGDTAEFLVPWDKHD